jgi:serine phosphatase RsbU (regulator of sigma subunit)
VLPEIEWLEMCGHYQPAQVTETVGGDWYDAFLCRPRSTDPAQTLTISVGDVAGHDTHAAAEMGRLVAKLRALAIDRPDEPDRLLQRLEGVMTANVHNRHASAIVANVTRDAAGAVSLTWSNAGHPPPLLLRPGSAPTYLSTAPDPLLGVSVTLPRRSDHTIDLPADSTLLLYTDGLVERRHEDIEEGMERLARVADRHRERPLTDFVAALIADAASEAHDDDTVLLAVRTPQEA